MVYNKHITLTSLVRRLGQLAFVALVATGCGGGSNTGGDAVTTPAPTPTPTPPAPGISLLAGSIGGPGNIDGMGAAARFNSPSGVAVDAVGNVYVADSNNHTIRKITPQGVVTTLAGRAGVAGSDDGSGAAARFEYPRGLAADAAGNVYVATRNAVRKFTPVGVVTTLAGTAGVSGSTDGVGASARFEGANGVAVDSAGQVYVSDSGNHIIRKISPSGVVTTLAGTAGAEGTVDGTGPAARFSRPSSLAVDASGNVYVVDGNGIGRKITPEGVVTTTTVRATSVAVDGIGNVYVADYNNHTIRKITPTGSPTTLAGTDGVWGSTDGVGAAASFLCPGGIAADSAGNVYVADNGNHTIRRVSTAGVVTTLAGSARQRVAESDANTTTVLTNADGVAVAPNGDVYVTVGGSTNTSMRRITPDGAVTRVVGAESGLGGAASYNFHAVYPGGVAADQSGNLYTANGPEHSVRRITQTGVVTTWAGANGSIWGPAGGTGAEPFFYAPHSVAVDSIGNLYVANIIRFDLSNIDLGPVKLYANTVLKISPTGDVTTLAGTVGVHGVADGVGTAASFNQPNGIAVDGAGFVYVADTGNHTVRKISPTGTVTTLAGTAGVRGWADGNGPAASFDSLAGIAVDKAGNVYVTDTRRSDSGDSGVIRKITPAGDVTTVVGQRGSMGIALGSLPGSLSSLRGIAVDARGVLCVATEAAVLKIQLPQ